MATQAASGTGVGPILRARCRCGHLPTHHMQVAAIAGTASFQLVPSGPCAICGENQCRRYTPGGP